MRTSVTDYQLKNRKRMSKLDLNASPKKKIRLNVMRFPLFGLRKPSIERY